MQSPSTREASQACLNIFCLTSLSSVESANPKPLNLIANSRANFATATSSSLFPDTQFTNHESLPSLSESSSIFTKAYPQFIDTVECDHIRDHEYYHLALSNRVYLDYVGFGLFSSSQRDSLLASSSSHSTTTSHTHFFDVCYKSASLTSQVLYGGQETPIESAIRKRIMSFLNVNESEYSLVCAANQASAFKLLAESYTFQSNRRLITVYDYKSEAVTAMIESSKRRGARVMSASFNWPSLRINSTRLKNVLVSKRKKKKKGLFVFPLQSRMTGARYSYQWMNIAQENGWHVLLDVCALGPKDMDTLGLSIFQPDFLICSFYKVFGENPSGFGCLFVKKTSTSVLETSTMAESIGIVSIVPPRKFCSLPDDFSSTNWETKSSEFQSHEDYFATKNSLFGPMSPGKVSNEQNRLPLGSSDQRFEGFHQGETSDLSEVVALDATNATQTEKNKTIIGETDEYSIQCKGLDHADSLGLPLISSRVRFLINWLVSALMKLYHPHTGDGIPLVTIYGPKVKFDRGPSVAFNVFDWKGEKIEPMLVQKLADRNNISLSYGFIENIWFSDKCLEDMERVLETREDEVAVSGHKRKEKVATGIMAVTASIGYLANFEDIYRLWAFVAKFLDADFVEKEKWRYMALNQKTIEV